MFWLTSLVILAMHLAHNKAWPFIPKHPYAKPIDTVYLPYCSCVVYPDNDPFGCECFDDEPLTEEMEFPEIPINASYLRLGVRDEDFDAELDCRANETSYSYITANTARIPTHITALRFIKLTNFDFDGDRIKQLNPWLDTVKDSLTDLTIACGRLASLGPEVLRGLSHLKSFHIHKTGLEQIEPGAFGELGFGSPAIPDGLAWIGLDDSNLEVFDWSTLLPVASTIQVFSLSSNRKLRTMQVSVPVLFPALEWLHLTDNAFETVPAHVVATWPLSQNLSVYLKRSPVCPQDCLCRCCSLLPLIHFAASQTNHSTAYISLNCGDPDGKPANEIPHTLRNNIIPLCDKEHYSNATVADVMIMVDMSYYDKCNEIGDYNGPACKVR